MDRLDQHNKRSMRLFAILLVSAAAIITWLTLGSAIHKLISGL